MTISIVKEMIIPPLREGATWNGIEITEADVKRFVAKIEQYHNHWLFTGGKSGGYGSFALRHGRTIRAHVFAYIAWKDSIIGDGRVYHLCDYHACVNPDDLFDASDIDSLLDASTVSAIRQTFRRGQTQKEIAEKFGIKSRELVKLIIAGDKS